MVKKFLKRFDLYHTTKEDYKNNSARILDANEKMFFSSILIFVVTFAVLSVASFFVYTLASNRDIYIAALIFFVFLILLENYIISGYGIWMSYVLSLGLFMIGLQFSVDYVAHMSSMILPFFIIVPIIVVDEGWRINSFVFTMWVISVLSSFLTKTNYIARYDLIHFTVFAIVGVFLGEVFKGTRMRYFNNLYLLSNQKYIDQLTGLYNRRKLHDDMNEDASHSMFIGVIMIDIDWFKKMNDTFGHEKGDDCLKAICNCFKELGAKYELNFYRYGGEEFLAVSKTHSNQKLRKIANEILSRIRALNIPADYSCFGIVTVSIGFTEGLITNIHEYMQLIDKADKALYEAKRVSRNTCIGYVEDKFV